MKMSEALETVNNLYVPGVVEFYARAKDDRWQLAHDEFEGSVVIYEGDPSIYEKKVSAASDRFVARITDLKIRGAGRSKDTGHVIGFYSNSERQADARMSVSDGRCAKCGSERNVRIKLLRGTGSPGLYCHACVPEQESFIL